MLMLWLLDFERLQLAHFVMVPFYLAGSLLLILTLEVR